MTRPYTKRDPRQRFWEKVDRGEDCWLWMATRDRHGYGQFFLDGSKRAAHRVSYEWDRGPVPDGLVIDHLCRTPACVRPDHMEPVTQAENVRRGVRTPQRWSHCIRNHPFDETNTYVSPGTGFRACRICKRQRQIDRRARLARAAG